MINDSAQEERWRNWVEKELPGPSTRVNAIMGVVFAGIVRCKTPNEIAASARQAALEWDLARAQPPLERSGTAQAGNNRPIQGTGGIYDMVAANKTPLGQEAKAALDAIDLRVTMRAKSFFATRGFRGGYAWHGSSPARRSGKLFAFGLLLVVLIMMLSGKVAFAGIGCLPGYAPSNTPRGNFCTPVPTAVTVDRPKSTAPDVDEPKPTSGKKVGDTSGKKVGEPNNKIATPWIIRLPSRFYAMLAAGMILILFARLAWILVLTPVRAHCATVEIRHGRISLKYGLLSTTPYVAEVHWIREVMWSQSFTQKLLGEATILLHLDTPSRNVETLCLPGLVPMSEIQQYVDKLRNAAQRLRGGNNYFAQSFVN